MKILLTVFFLCFSLVGFAQRNDKQPRYFGDPFVADSSSTIMIPIRYNDELLSANKIVLWNDFYSNIIFYDFTTDTYQKLFDTDTYIKGFARGQNFYNRYDRGNPLLENTSSKWIFYFVKPIDFNNNGRIDSDDPSVLYLSDRSGNNLQAITPDSESAVSIEIFDQQGFALIKMQRDMDGNRRFEAKDKDFYYVRFDLNRLALGNKIEIK